MPVNRMRAFESSVCQQVLNIFGTLYYWYCRYQSFHTPDWRVELASVVTVLQYLPLLCH